MDNAFRFAWYTLKKVLRKISEVQSIIYVVKLVVYGI